MIIAITGPTGSGKSTVAKALCQKFEKCVRLDIDRVKHFVETGFIYDESDVGQKQWDLCAKNIAMLAKNFFDEGYVVVIEGVFYEIEWSHVFKILPDIKKFLLLPEEKITKNRDALRDPKWAMGEEAIEGHYVEFVRDYYHQFVRIDSTKDSVDETVEHIYTQCK